MDYSIDNHTITLPSGEVIPTAEACRWFRITIPMVEIYCGRDAGDYENEPQPRTRPELLTDAYPGMHDDGDGVDIDRDTIVAAYDGLCRDIARVTGEDIMGERFAVLWASLRERIAVARGGPDGQILHLRERGYISTDADVDDNGIGYVTMRQSGSVRTELSPEEATNLAAYLLAAADQAKHPGE
jgi:hypothetical protein